MKSRVSVSIWFGTSLKFVRRRLPASVSVAIQPVWAVSEITKGKSSTTGSSSVRAAGRAAADGGSVWANALSARIVATAMRTGIAGGRGGFMAGWV